MLMSWSDTKHFITSYLGDFERQNLSKANVIMKLMTLLEDRLLIGSKVIEMTITEVPQGMKFFMRVAGVSLEQHEFIINKRAWWVR